MSLSPVQGLALDELAQHLYDYLLGKPHPYGNKELSFPAVAAELGLERHWPGGSKQGAIRQLLEGTLQSGTGKFSLLAVRIVQRGITRRKRGDPVTRQDIETVNELLAPGPTGALHMTECPYPSMCFSASWFGGPWCLPHGDASVAGGVRDLPGRFKGRPAEHNKGRCRRRRRRRGSCHPVPLRASNSR
jgi:hypothetical protein